MAALRQPGSDLSRNTVQLERDPESGLYATMTFENGVAVYVYERPAWHGDVPPQVPHSLESEWAWLRLERWESTL
jgi:hypothetical protein